jgi:polyferredoxin
MSWHELKLTLYVVLALSGAGMVVTSFCIPNPTRIPDAIGALVLLCTGVAMLFFSLTTYFIRDEADVWD